MKLTAVNFAVLFAFFGSLAGFVAIWAGVDVWLATRFPSGSTISWSIALMGQYPIAVAILWFVAGFVFGGLTFHFFWGMPSPADWQEQLDLKAEVESLQAEIARLQAGSTTVSSRRPGADS